MESELQKLHTKLKRIEAALEKCRTSSFKDGWQTQKHAKKSRNWDYYAKQKFIILQQIEDYHEKNKLNKLP